MKYFLWFSIDTNALYLNKTKERILAYDVKNRIIKEKYMFKLMKGIYECC